MKHLLWIVLCLCSYCAAQLQPCRNDVADPLQPSIIDPCDGELLNVSLSHRETPPGTFAMDSSSLAVKADASAVIQPGVEQAPRPVPLNRQIFYRNRTELSVEGGWLPINVPFVFNFMVGDPYVEGFRTYRLAPVFVSLRWQPWEVNGWGPLRGSTEFSFSGSATLIPQSHGAETRYFAFDYGIRRYFVPRSSRVVPYFEMRGGIGNINAKGMAGCCTKRRGRPAAQGEDTTFTLMIGSGLRYDVNPRFAVTAGVSYMHVSNAYLSEPKFEDYGINVYGPMVGIIVRLGQPHPSTTTY